MARAMAFVHGKTTRSRMEVSLQPDACKQGAARACRSPCGQIVELLERRSLHDCNLAAPRLG